MSVGVAMLREQIGLSQSDLARALNVSLMTVKRWEEQGIKPSGLAADVIRGIGAAIEDGADPKSVGRTVRMGIGALICYGLLRQLEISPLAKYRLV